MATSIQISRGLKDALGKRKISGKDTYEDIIWDLLEDSMELSEDAKREIEAAREEAARGETVSLEEFKRSL